MRRYTFYLSIALLAFGIGSLVVFKFYRKVENVSPKVEEISETTVFAKRFGDIRFEIKNRALEMPTEYQPSSKRNAFTCK